MDKTKRATYSAKFKLSVINFAESNNNCAAARKYGVSEKLVRDWRKAREKLSKMPKAKCADRGRACSWPNLEENLKKWILDQRQSGFIVTRNAIRLKAKTLAKAEKLTEFQASASWCTRFMNRQGLFFFFFFFIFGETKIT